MDTDLCLMSAMDLREAYRSRSLSPVEVTEAVLQQIDSLNSKLNAFITVTPERALADAKTAEKDYASGDARELSGIPISIKDLVDTRGIRTTGGSLLNVDRVPEHDPVFVQRLYRAGVVMLGKTNTPEGGWKGDSGNRIIGPTHNPWRHGLTAGGSSGGAAAAIATGMGALAQGGDGAGSIRIPAAFCGIFGHKPSFGRVPYPGISPTQIAHTGPMTRTVEDAALMLDVIAGPDPSDRHSLARHPGFVEDLAGGLRGLRIAWSPDLGYAPVESEVAELCNSAVKVFEDLGCQVEETQPGLDDPWDIEDMLFGIGQAGGVADRLDEIRDQLDPGRVKVIERLMSKGAVEFQRAHVAREHYYRDMMAFMESYDLLITPTLPITAFEAGKDYPEEINGIPQTYLGWTPFTYPFNLTGQPAASVPCGFTDDGLPVGLQIVGGWRDDALVLRAAARFEEVRPWRHVLPPMLREEASDE
ncbi:MAG: amidase [Chloroflexota bacterium]